MKDSRGIRAVTEQSVPEFRQHGFRIFREFQPHPWDETYAWRGRFAQISGRTGVPRTS
jgi:hypothetical protein